MVGIPTLGSLSMATYASLPNLREGDVGIHIHFSTKKPLDAARNDIIENFLSSDCTHLLFLDTDILLPRNILSLLERDVDVITALYGIWKEGVPIFNIFEDTIERGVFRPINTFERGELKEISACGLGCILIRRNVLEKVNKPWCSFSSWDEKKEKMFYAEDFHFCQKMIRAGYKVFADTRVECGHLVTMNVIEVTNYIDARFRRARLTDDLEEFTGLSKDEINKRIKYSTERIAEEWERLKPKTEADINQFYRDTPLYIFDLTHYNTLPKSVIRSRTIAAKVYGRVLDYGAGIGSYLIDCWDENKRDLTYIDLRGKTWDFAEWRFKKTGMKVNMIEPSELEGKYDCILLMDVLEHLPNWREVLTKLITEHLNEDGSLFVTEVWGGRKGDDMVIHPQHMPIYRGEIKNLLDKLLEGRKVRYYLWKRIG